MLAIRSSMAMRVLVSPWRFQLLEPLVVGGNVETVEDGPVQVDACIESLVKHSVVLGCLSGGSGLVSVLSMVPL